MSKVYKTSCLSSSNNMYLLLFWEDWSRYDLSDNSILKIKTILTRVFKNQATYTIDFQNIVAILTNERGNINSRPHSASDLQNSIIQEDVRYTTITQDWNEYVVDDGTRIKIQPLLMNVSKTSLFDSSGIPIYLVNSQATVQIRPPRNPI